MLLETFQEEDEEDLLEYERDETVSQEDYHEEIHTDTDDDDDDADSEQNKDADQKPLDQLPTNLHAMRVIHKGRKYDWQAKLNLHIHIIEHVYYDTIEVVAFNTSNFTESNRAYLSISTVNEKVSDIISQENIDAINQEYTRLKLPLPKKEEVILAIKQNRTAAYILEKLVVTMKQNVFIDIKEPKAKGSVQGKLGSNDRRTTISKGSSTTGDHVLVSITQKKHEHLIEATIKRYGKSATLVGDVVGVRTSKEEELLSKIVTNINSPILTSQAKRIISRQNTITPLAKQNTKRTPTRHDTTSQLKGFHKFRGDTDLLQESLSFLHISEMLVLQRVCKKWHSVLSALVRSASSLCLTSRDFHYNSSVAMLVQYQCNRIRAQRERDNAQDELEEHDKPQWNEELDAQQMKIRRRVNIPSNLLQEAKFLANPNTSFEVRATFVKSETVLRALKSSSRSLSELRLHYVILSREVIAFMSCLAGKLRKLSIGVVKFNDQSVRPTSKRAKSVRSRRARSVYSVRSSQSRRPNLPAPSSSGPRTRRLSMNIQATGADRPNSHGESEPDSDFSDSSDEENEKARPPEAPASYFKFLQYQQLKEILIACGSEVTHLELSVTMGELLPEIFKFVPRLQHFSVTDSLLAPIVSCRHDKWEGNVSLEEFSRALAGISMLELLALVADAEHEAFLITDRRGRIVVANAAFEEMFGYRTREMHGQTIDFLTGSFTKLEEFEAIRDALKNQLKAEEATIFLYHKHGEPLLTQVICLPNIARLKSAPLSYDCLEPDVLGRLAVEDEEQAQKQSSSPRQQQQQQAQRNKGKLNWKSQHKELSYHLLRFGYLSDSFAPFDAEMTSEAL